MALHGEVGGPTPWGRPLWIRRRRAAAQPGPSGKRLPIEEVAVPRGQGVQPRTAQLPPRGTRYVGVGGVVIIWLSVAPHGDNSGGGGAPEAQCEYTNVSVRCVQL